LIVVHISWCLLKTSQLQIYVARRMYEVSDQASNAHG